MEISKSVEVKKSFSLKELVENYEQIKGQLEAQGEESDDVLDMYDVAKALLAGKLDTAVKLQQSLEAHTEACRKQIEHNEKMVDRIHDMIEEAVLLTPSQSISGLAYQAKMKKTPPSVRIIDEASIPAEFKHWVFDVTDKFEFTNSDKFFKYASFVLGRTVVVREEIKPEEEELLKDCFDVTVDKRKLAAALKQNGDIGGAILESKLKLDIKVGKSLLEVKNEGQ